MYKNDIRFTAELQAASRRFINRLVAIADEFGVDRDEVVFGEVASLCDAIKDTTFEVFDVMPDDYLD